MHAFDGTAAWVVHTFEGGIPFKGDGGGAGDAGFAGDALGGRVGGEVFGEDAAIVVFLFILRWVDGESLCGVSHLFIANSLSGDLLQGVNP